jgi:hypothetical protein
MVLAATSVAFAQSSTRGWVDVDFIGAKSAQDEQLFVTSGIARDGFTAVGISSAYPELPTAKGLGVGGGVQFHPMFGVGVQWDLASYEYIAGIGLSGIGLVQTIDGASTDSLERTQNAVNINGVFILPTPDAWRIRVFGGPTYFSVKQEMVSNFTFRNLLGIVEIGNYEIEDVKESGWGFNAGVDVAYFFTRVVGVGGVVRFNAATLDFEDPLTGNDGEIKAGHTIFGAGLRLRF